MRVNKLILLVLFLASQLIAEPFLAPNDPFLRHEIRMLGDSGELSGLQNTWPLDLGGLSAMRAEQSSSLPHNLLDDRISLESQSGWSPIFTTLGISDDRVTARGFGPEPRSSFATNASVSWMNDRFAAKLSLNAFYGMETDWKGRKDEGFALDGSYIAARLGNWSASFGQVERWWGPGWDGSLILSTNARPIPAISIDRRIPEPFETKWFSWIGPWSFHSFIGQLEKERAVPNPYLWGMRGEVRPTLIDGLEVGFFRMMQLGGDGRPKGFKTWADAFLSQDNYGGNSRHQDTSKEPGNQLAGVDFRWKVLDSSLALYFQLAGEDEENFLPEALFFLYGLEHSTHFKHASVRLFAEYVDLTTYRRRKDDPTNRNITYSHSIYQDGYRYRGRTIGHWADQDSQLISVGGLLQKRGGVGWGTTLRSGKLNEDNSGQSTVSNRLSADYFSIDLFNTRPYPQYGLSVYTSLGWESLKPSGLQKNDGLSGFLSLSRSF